jgi:hypothetical protein
MLAAATAAGSLAVWMIDYRPSPRAARPDLRRGPSGELPTLYLHKLR